MPVRHGAAVTLSPPFAYNYATTPLWGCYLSRSVAKRIHKGERPHISPKWEEVWGQDGARCPKEYACGNGPSTPGPYHWDHPRCQSHQLYNRHLITRGIGHGARVQMPHAALNGSRGCSGLLPPNPLLPLASNLRCSPRELS